MDCVKMGRLIARLRKEKRLTQQNMADALNISNKTVSKWECGLGCPDVSLWADLSVILGVDIAQMLEGEIILNRPDVGNIDKIRFYVCPSCKNVLVSTGSSSIFCCGRKIEQLFPVEVSPQEKSLQEKSLQEKSLQEKSLQEKSLQEKSLQEKSLQEKFLEENPLQGNFPKENKNIPNITVEVIDVDYFITIDHEMTRDHYILFAAYVKSDRVFLTRLYPEQSATVRIPYNAGGKLYLYCIKHGLTVYPITLYE